MDSWPLGAQTARWKGDPCCGWTTRPSIVTRLSIGNPHRERPGQFPSHEKRLNLAEGAPRVAFIPGLATVELRSVVWEDETRGAACIRGCMKERKLVGEHKLEAYAFLSFFCFCPICSAICHNAYTDITGCWARFAHFWRGVPVGLP